jgi:ERCC4-related helicase
MNILLKQVRDLVKTQKTDPTTMHPYLFQSAMQNVKASGKPWAYSVVSFLGAMARCISKLLEQSVDSFYEELQGLRKSAKGKAVEVINHRDFASIYRDTEDMINGQGFAGHPKMVRLAELVQEHFEQAKKDGCLETTRIMVFCTYRQVVDEIVQRLNAFDGVRATRLVGQGTDTKGKKGLGQKQQNKTLADFKKGDFNVLVATSIGEEGLDIGELDLIICYDAAKSPVRTVSNADFSCTVCE